MNMELEIPNLDNPTERKKLVKYLGIFRKLRKISRARALQLFARSQNGVKDSLIITGQEIDVHEEKYLLSVFRRSFPMAHRPTLFVNPKLQ